jgi:hypothetical protein
MAGSGPTVLRRDNPDARTGKASIPNQLKAASHCRWTRSSGCKIMPDVLSEASESWRGEHLIFDGASI